MAVAEKVALVIGLYGTTDLRRRTPEHLTGLDEMGYSIWETSFPGMRPRQRIWPFLRLLSLMRRCDVIFTDEYFNAVIVSGLLWLFRLKSRHVVIGLNVSGNKSLVTRWSLLNRALNRVFQRMDLIFVASRAEVDIFSALHAIPRERFSFLHWAYDLPMIPGTFAKPRRPYFCMIGRNNRDIATFAEALRGLEADGVIVCQQPIAVPLPENVMVHREIPLGECIDCIKGSVGNVVLVQDATRGAGHITIVTAMHCGKPQIISSVPTTLDYFIDGRHAITVGLGDVGAVRAAMIRLLSDPALCRKMGGEAQAYAAVWLGHKRRVNVLSRRINGWLQTGQVERVDPAWLEATS